MVLDSKKPIHILGDRASEETCEKIKRDNFCKLFYGLNAKDKQQRMSDWKKKRELEEDPDLIVTEPISKKPKSKTQVTSQNKLSIGDWFQKASANKSKQNPPIRTKQKLPEARINTTKIVKKQKEKMDQMKEGVQGRTKRAVRDKAGGNNRKEALPIDHPEEPMNASQLVKTRANTRSFIEAKRDSKTSCVTKETINNVGSRLVDDQDLIPPIPITLHDLGTGSNSSIDDCSSPSLKHSLDQLRDQVSSCVEGSNITGEVTTEAMKPDIDAVFTAKDTKQPAIVDTTREERGEEEDLESPLTSSDSDESDSDDQGDMATDYELMREKRIQENKRMMASLGLLSIARDMEPTKKAGMSKRDRPKPKPKPKTGDDMVTRRSARVSARLLGTNMSEDSLVAAAMATALHQEAPKEVEEVEALELGQVIPCLPSGKGPVTANTSCDIPRTQLLSGHSHAIYDLSLSADGSILAAGGGEGRITFFPFTSETYTSTPQENTVALGTSKVHSRWISHIKYLAATEDDGDLLLSASDDCSLVLTAVKATNEEIVVRPKARLGPNKLHSRGVFGMDELNGFVATCSKDGSIGVSSLTGVDMQVVSTYDDVHSGVAKSIRWQPGQSGQPAIMVSTGNDMTINIFDTRTSSTVQTLEGRHSNAINSILFNPVHHYQFITSAFDKTIVGHDMRKLQDPLFTLSGHHGPNVSKASLTAPIYDDKGAYVITSGDKSNDLHSYSIESGALYRRMYVGFTASCLASIPGTPQLVAAYGKQHIWRFLDGM